MLHTKRYQTRHETITPLSNVFVWYVSNKLFYFYNTVTTAAFAYKTELDVWTRVVRHGKYISPTCIHLACFKKTDIYDLYMAASPTRHKFLHLIRKEMCLQGAKGMRLYMYIMLNALN